MAVCGGIHRVSVSKVSDIYTLYTIGDIHLGSKGCSLSKLREDVAQIAKDPLALVVGMGDYADYIGPRDKRWDPATLPEDIKIKDLGDWGNVLAKWVVKELKPIRGKIVGMLCGNHENTYENMQAQALHGWVCGELNTKNLGYCCFFDLSFNKNLGKRSSVRRYRLFAHHGAGAAQTAGGKINRLARFMDTFEADVYLIGHVHEQYPLKKPVLRANEKCTDCYDHNRIGVFTGTYLRTYSAGDKPGYGERAGFAPTPLGCSKLRFQPFARDWRHRTDSLTAEVNAY